METVSSHRRFLFSEIYGVVNEQNEHNVSSRSIFWSDKVQSKFDIYTSECVKVDISVLLDITRTISVIVRLVLTTISTKFLI
jgi:hypothetical protein